MLHNEVKINNITDINLQCEEEWQKMKIKELPANTFQILDGWELFMVSAFPSGITLKKKLTKKMSDQCQCMLLVLGDTRSDPVNCKNVRKIFNFSLFHSIPQNGVTGLGRSPRKIICIIHEGYQIV